jgi:hypothetical protein
VKVVGEEEVLETWEMGGEPEVEDGTGQKSVMFVTDRKRVMGSVTIVVRDINFGWREDRVSREDAALTSET